MEGIKYSINCLNLWLIKSKLRECQSAEDVDYIYIYILIKIIKIDNYRG